jgi:uncharacterized damage-inducible protein DinB
MSEDLRYPIGNFEKPAGITNDMRRENIKAIKELPGELACALHGLDAGQMDTEYRPGGWTVRQVVHHVADSHLNAYCRFKLALTEEGPTIKPYDEAAWAELPDNTTSAEVSLQLTEGLHKRFANLLDGMSESDFGRTLVHPESGPWTLDEMLALYAWHSKHHTAHITALRAREGW